MNRGNTLYASRVVDRIVNGWRGAPKVTVVESVKDLPVEVPGDVMGIFYRGDTWVVVDTQATSQIPQTLAHEALGHYAMREVLGQNWRSFMHAVQGGIRAGDWRLAYVRQSVRERYIDDSGACTLSSTYESDEIAAAVVELVFDGETGRMAIPQPLRMMARAGVGHVAREGLYINRPACMDELLGTLLAAEHRLRFGGPLWGLGYRLRRWYAPAMAKPWNPKSPPMSLRESDNLLKAESDRLKWWTDLKFGFDGIVLVACLVALPVLLIVMASGWVDWIGRLFK